MTFLDPHRAAELFAERLALTTDVSDVRADLVRGEFVLIDVRNQAAWDQGHIPGAVHLPQARIAGAAALEADKPFVAYCWGPGCNGALRAAQALAARGFRVKEMLGGIEYWIREGFPVQTANGEVSVPVDTLTACGC
jgi:rhodanese-related sulfurtransferase